MLVLSRKLLPRHLCVQTWCISSWHSEGCVKSLNLLIHPIFCKTWKKWFLNHKSLLTGWITPASWYWPFHLHTPLQKINTEFSSSWRQTVILFLFVKDREAQTQEVSNLILRDWIQEKKKKRKKSINSNKLPPSGLNKWLVWDQGI